MFLKRAQGMTWGGLGLAFLAIASWVQADGIFPWSSSGKPVSVENVAKKVNKLEHNLERAGTVVAKAPDVWGQARLTQYRDEFEKQMAAQLNAFSPSINAEIARTDQAYLAEALSLSALVNASKKSDTTDGPDKVDLTAVNTMVSPITGTTVPPEGSQGATGSVANSFTVARRDPFGNLQIASNPFGKDAVIALEPEILLDQRQRFLNHLHQIRRDNEGDDTADAPGYSLNLVRIPISVLPGTATREGYGAEITITATPHLTEDLLPTTFRALVVNDLVDQLSFPIVKYLEMAWPLLLEKEQLQAYTERVKATADAVSVAATSNDKNKFAETLQSKGLGRITDGNFRFDSMVPIYGNTEKNIGGFDIGKIQSQVEGAKNDAEDRQKAVETRLNDVDKMLSGLLGSFGERSRRSRFAIPPSQLADVYGGHELSLIAQKLFELRDRKRCDWSTYLTDCQSFLREEIDAAYDYVTHHQVPKCFDESGNCCYVSLWDWVDPTLGQQIRAGLKAGSAGNQLETARGVGMCACTKANRAAFFLTIHGKDAGQPTYPAETILSLPPMTKNNPTCKENLDDNCFGQNVTEALAWGVIVESILLNDRLKEDMQHVAQDPECGCQPNVCCDFYGANPTPEAKQAFMNYVRCRWPIHVFALDPIVQQQNVADSLSVRREMQLAIALAFTARRANAQSLTRYMRRLETDMRTIALNNTAVAFGHGANVFGWRFFPRVQTPPFEGNLTVVMRDLLVGGPDKDAMLRRQRLEPGMRECTAIMVMPSFIKHVKFDTRSDWFKLTHSFFDHGCEFRPKMSYVMNWSEDVRSMQEELVCCLAEQDRYRAGDVDRLVARVDQLGQALPMQTLYSQVPYENTLGGFEMFSSGVTDLAPELIGFYGVPGIDRSKSTELLLVGNHFSVHDTRILAGNKMCEGKMLSRQVMQVTIPPGVQSHKRHQMPPAMDGFCPNCKTSGAACVDCKTEAQPTPASPVPLKADCFVPVKGSDKDDCCPLLTNPCCNTEFIEIRLATPYGVTGPLEVPVVHETAVPGKPQLAWGLESYQVEYRYVINSTSDMPPQRQSVEVGDTDIAIPGSHRLAIKAKGGMVVPNGANAKKIEFSLDGSAPGVSPASAVFKLDDVPFDAEGKQFVILSQQFVEFHTKLRTAAMANAQGGDKKKLPSNFSAQLSATVYLDTYTAVPVDGALKIDFKFAER